MNQKPSWSQLRVLVWPFLGGIEKKNRVCALWESEDSDPLWRIYIYFIIIQNNTETKKQSGNPNLYHSAAYPFKEKLYAPGPHIETIILHFFITNFLLVLEISEGRFSLKLSLYVFFISNWDFTTKHWTLCACVSNWTNHPF